MEWANTSAFWGLTGIAIPTIVFLLSKKKQTIIPFGSITFLQESESRTARSILPSQWLLYLLRIVLLTIFVIWQAKPLFELEHPQKRVVVEKQLYESPEWSDLDLDLQVEPDIVDPSSLWLLARKYNQSGDSVIIFTRGLRKDFKGSSIPLSRTIEWKTIPYKDASSRTDTLVHKDQSVVVEIKSDEQGITWESNNTAKTVNEEPIKIKILASGERKDEANQVRAIIDSYQQNLPLAFEYVDENYDLLMRIDTIAHQESSTYFDWSHFVGSLRLQKHYHHAYKISGSLNRESLTESNFAVDLAAVILNEYLNLSELDRTVKNELNFQDQAKVKRAKIKSADQSYIWISALLIVLFVERYFAYQSIKG
ncbi:BatA domain-containing protein [Portibacter marinus]|uniref:BatA domain-containing protein n=1 Tax=Portibacter marinus TaxID=2898660 RepID=UPI001F43EA41|nr:BatA domain-containing protein [Portibacter marinus]